MIRLAKHDSPLRYASLCMGRVSVPDVLGTCCSIVREECTSILLASPPTYKGLSKRKMKYVDIQSYDLTCIIQQSFNVTLKGPKGYVAGPQWQRQPEQRSKGIVDISKYGPRLDSDLKTTSCMIAR